MGRGYNRGRVSANKKKGGMHFFTRKWLDKFNWHSVLFIKPFPSELISFYVPEDCMYLFISKETMQAQI